MGILFSSLWRRISGFREVKICMIGLDAAGKTTILYKLHLGEVVSTYPTIGSNVEEVSFRNMRFQVWDLGGQDMLRQTWKTYFINTHALIMVVDSADVKRLDLARTELHAVLDSDELRDSCVLIFANKQDLKESLTATELSEALALHTIRTHDWHIQACSAIKGEGLYEGLEWISTHVRQE
ncbi:ADP-ribosylation factor [Gracilariopsis chorda]|uniref:ADP-ribosylation factor n=1 Tax=Gracilariopsis chorda TaxID=448386 RepID=A0A2V3J620_9FLOR|nr:ADP-ribosylation factor [Gracilariopsis chorda]|eukprot:PXF48830.1 ADP-ribosylation factor [Gracilariopsis chorda]